jgi:primary-amine oxidase
VTPYQPDELYAAGPYPTQSQPGEGLPKWTAANRRIESTDIVVWCTMGMHHVVRAVHLAQSPFAQPGKDLVGAWSCSWCEHLREGRVEGLRRAW